MCQDLLNEALIPNGSYQPNMPKTVIWTRNKSQAHGVSPECNPGDDQLAGGLGQIHPLMLLSRAEWDRSLPTVLIFGAVN